MTHARLDNRECPHCSFDNVTRLDALNRNVAIVCGDRCTSRKALVDEDEIEPAQVERLSGRRLNAREDDRLEHVLAAQPGAVDAKRGLRPDGDDLFRVLLDELSHMGEHQDALPGPLLQRLPDDGGDQERLSAPRWEHEDRIPALVFAEPSVEAVDRLALIGAQLDAHPTTCASNRTFSSSTKSSPQIAGLALISLDA